MAQLLSSKWSKFALNSLRHLHFCQKGHRVFALPSRLAVTSAGSLHSREDKRALPLSHLQWRQLRTSTQRHQVPGGSVTGHVKLLKKSGQSGNGKTLDETEVAASQVFRALVQHIWPKDHPSIRKRVIIALSLLIGGKLINVQVPFVFKYAIDGLNSIINMSDAAVASTSTVMALIASYAVLRACAFGFNELRSAIFARVAEGRIRNMANQTFLHLHTLDLNFHLSCQTGGLARAVNRGTRGMNYILNALVFNIAPTIFEVTLVSSILAYKFGAEFAVVTTSTIAAYVAYTLITTQWRTKFRIQMNKADNNAAAKAVDSLTNYETVKYFGNESYEAMQHDKYLAAYETASLKVSSSLAMLNFGQQAIFSVGLGLVMLLAAREAVAGRMTVGDLVMVNALVFQLSMPLNFLGSVYRDLRQSLIDMSAMFNLLNLSSSIKSPPDAPHLILNPNDRPGVVFDNVCFSYLEDRPILSGLSLRVPPGKKTAIVGGSGSGKSTIVRLLFRFYDPSSGTISVNGQDIRQLSLESLRVAIGIVPQDSVLFHDTIYHNLSYGNLSASEEDVHKAAAMANLDQTIRSFPQQYQTEVGERGLKLSGGEKQRVAIARALLKNPPIIVYDEATSSLDYITEQQIMQALSTVSFGRTSIFIAHRLSTIADADEIFVLEGGKVAEQGTHNQLLASPSSLYAELWHSQRAAKPV